MDSNANEVVDDSINVGFEHELTDYLLRATQDELNATADADDMTLFVDEETNSSATNSDENGDFAGDAIDVALSATSFFAGWINEPINGCQSGEYGRTNTPNEISTADENTCEELLSECRNIGDPEVKEIVGEPTWRDAVTDQILVGLGLRQTSRIEGEYNGSVDSEKEQTLIELVHDETDTPERQEDTRQESPSQYDQAEIRNDEDQSVTSNNDMKREVMSADERDDSNERGDLLADSSCQRGNVLGNRTDGKKNDVLKKLVAKCLARNKKSQEHRYRPKRLPLEPESCVFQLQRPEPSTVDNGLIQAKSSDSVVSAKLGKVTNRAVIHWLKSDVPSIEIVSQENSLNDDIRQSEPETRDASICSEGKASISTSRDPPATWEPQKRIGRPQTLQLKMNTIGRSLTMTGSAQSTNPNSIPKQEESPLELKMKSAGRAPIYYSQPPRPEVPFLSAPSNDSDVSRTAKKAAKQIPSSSCQANTEEKVDTVRMSLFRDSVLSSTALLRRKHYRELLLKERIAGNTTIE
ncbi:hypothetical protein HJC23_014061 [Cyclotella cryptica]|uniref:Uncharacterized protein n=1 Tax=Cyclotella cryptica TaxID=29204 RepID=A0ABD3QTL6_9STRA|eukprot:CCRYP_002454-RA/>CCRYP_002454-RA protein AED:0.34 eAED:0.34 QI:0/-1/0/1/-1/1/1/0/524